MSSVPSSRTPDHIQCSSVVMCTFMRNLSFVRQNLLAHVISSESCVARVSYDTRASRMCVFVRVSPKCVFGLSVLFSLIARFDTHARTHIVHVCLCARARSMSLNKCAHRLFDALHVGCVCTNCVCNLCACAGTLSRTCQKDLTHMPKRSHI